MIIYRKIKDIAQHLDNQRKEGHTIGFVPTMGALHNGHISLITASNIDNDLTVCSIFVNPTQFNNSEDFEKYPTTLDNDIDLLELNDCDILFLPATDEIYPPNFIKQHYELGALADVLEGKHRPGHFQGVCMVVDKLISIIQCDTLYLGQKDYQQCLVISKLIELKGLNTFVKIMPTIREENGLAMSSRNKRLNIDEFNNAAVLYKTLSYLKNNIAPGYVNSIISEATNLLTNNGFIVDYIEVTNQQLEIISNWDGKSKTICLIAASINNVRLIDNLILT